MLEYQMKALDPPGINPAAFLLEGRNEKRAPAPDFQKVPVEVNLPARLLENEDFKKVCGMRQRLKKQTRIVFEGVQVHQQLESVLAFIEGEGSQRPNGFISPKYTMPTQHPKAGDIALAFHHPGKAISPALTGNHQ